MTSPIQEPTIPELTALIRKWADAKMPRRTPQSAFIKLFEELGEVIKDPHDQLEWADVMIMLLDLAAMYNVDLAQAITNKMEINNRRNWAMNELGAMNHV